MKENEMNNIKPPVAGTKILVGMSGGVDSSTAALLLKSAGWDVVGVTMLLWGGKRNGSSCSTADSSKAEAIAAEIGLPLITVDWTKEFDQQVLEDFKAGLVNGDTKNPCISCNSSFKVEGLVSLANEMGINYVSTGHYIQSHNTDGVTYLKRGVDTSKDQSYVLYMIPEEYRSKFVFPLGSLHKEEIRDIAANNGLSVADAPDSMDLCFNPAEDVKMTAVPVSLTRKGNVVGSHENGLALSIGQRKGVNIKGGGERLYVGEKDFSNGTVELHTAEEMMASTLRYEGVPMPDGTRALAQSSAHGTPSLCVINGNIASFDSPVRRTSPGQTVVFYGVDDLSECVVGGGIIMSYSNSDI